MKKWPCFGCSRPLWSNKPRDEKYTAAVELDYGAMMRLCAQCASVYASQFHGDVLDKKAEALFLRLCHEVRDNEVRDNEARDKRFVKLMNH